MSYHVDRDSSRVQIRMPAASREDEGVKRERSGSPADTLMKIFEVVGRWLQERASALASCWGTKAPIATEQTSLKERIALVKDSDGEWGHERVYS